MDARVIEQTIYEGSLAYAHGMGQSIRRFLVDNPAEGLLVINQGLNDEEVVAFFSPRLDLMGPFVDCGHTELPDDLCEQAAKVARANRALWTWRDFIEEEVKACKEREAFRKAMKRDEKK